LFFVLFLVCFVFLLIYFLFLCFCFLLFFAMLSTSPSDETTQKAYYCLSIYIAISLCGRYCPLKNDLVHRPSLAAVLSLLSFTCYVLFKLREIVK
jgi:hypothetical protein